MLQISVGNDKEISLTAHQKKCVTLLELKGKQLNDMVVDIIVPYAVTLPLTLMARAGRDRSNYEKNKATQYLLDFTPVRVGGGGGGQGPQGDGGVGSSDAGEDRCCTEPGYCGFFELRVRDLAG